MYVHQEALLSSRIEGTECTMDDVLTLELLNDAEEKPNIGEVVNYVAELDQLPLCNPEGGGMVYTDEVTRL